MQTNLIYIYTNAPKSYEDSYDVNLVRNYLKEIKGFRQINIIEREVNYGLAKSIIDGVTTIVNKYGRVIVLEDDIVTSRYFIEFINSALNLYENENKKMHYSNKSKLHSQSIRNTGFIMRWAFS